LGAALVLALSGTLSYLAGTTSLLLLIVFFTVHLSLIVIKRRTDSPIRTFCAPSVVPFLGGISCIALMPFVPRDSLLTAALILAVGGAIVVAGLRRARS
jgi:amino acid transporter